MYSLIISYFRLPLIPSHSNFYKTNKAIVIVLSFQFYWLSIAPFKRKKNLVIEILLFPFCMQKKQQTFVINLEKGKGRLFHPTIYT